MDDNTVTTAIEQLKDILTINEFLLKGIAPDEAQTALIAKSCILLGELGDTLDMIKEGTFKPSITKVA